MIRTFPVVSVFRFSTPLALRSSTTNLSAFGLGTGLLMVRITKIRQVILFTYLALAFAEALPIANLTYAANKGQETEEKEENLIRYCGSGEKTGRRGFADQSWKKKERRRRDIIKPLENGEFQLAAHTSTTSG